jgi:hypothetical protein
MHREHETEVSTFSADAPAPIEDLPYALLVKCLSFLPTITERVAAKLVCKTWNALLRSSADANPLWQDIVVDYHEECETAHRLGLGTNSPPATVRRITHHIKQHASCIRSIRLNRCVFRMQQVSALVYINSPQLKRVLKPGVGLICRVWIVTDPFPKGAIFVTRVPVR